MVSLSTGINPSGTSCLIFASTLRLPPTGKPGDSEVERAKRGGTCSDCPSLSEDTESLSTVETGLTMSPWDCLSRWWSETELWLETTVELPMEARVLKLDGVAGILSFPRYLADAAA